MIDLKKILPLIIDYTKILYGGVLPLKQSEDSADENKHIIQVSQSLSI